MQRHLIGIVALILLSVAALFWLMKGGALSTPRLLQGASADALHGASIRVGLVCGAFWLAWPHLRRAPAWLLQLTFLGAVVVAFRRQAAIVIIPLLIVMWIVRPRRK